MVSLLDFHVKIPGFESQLYRLTLRFCFSLPRSFSRPSSTVLWWTRLERTLSVSKLWKKLCSTNDFIRSWLASFKLPHKDCKDASHMECSHWSSCIFCLVQDNGKSLGVTFSISSLNLCCLRCTKKIHFLITSFCLPSPPHTTGKPNFFNFLFAA